MLSRRFRINNKNRITHILSKGRMFRTYLLRLKYLPSRLAYSRFSLVTGSKIGKTAVERNKIRRRVYEAIRKNYAAVPKQTCYDVVVLLSQKIVTAPYVEIERDFRTALKKLT